MYNYLRIVGLMMLILYSLAQRAWASVKPSLSPITTIHDNIDPDKVQVVSIVQQFVKVVFVVGVVVVVVVVEFSGVFLVCFLKARRQGFSPVTRVSSPPPSSVKKMSANKIKLKQMRFQLCQT